jgi:hypothetical protein
MNFRAKFRLGSNFYSARVGCGQILLIGLDQSWPFIFLIWPCWVWSNLRHGVAEYPRPDNYFGRIGPAQNLLLFYWSNRSNLHHGVAEIPVHLNI